MAKDETIAVCGRPTREGYPSYLKSGLCAICKSGTDRSGKSSEKKEREYLARERAMQTSRLPVDPNERIAELRFRSKVEQIRKAFDAEVVA